jgi:hypothetical protein
MIFQYIFLGIVACCAHAHVLVWPNEVQERASVIGMRVDFRVGEGCEQPVVFDFRKFPATEALEVNVPAAIARDGFWFAPGVSYAAPARVPGWTNSYQEHVRRFRPILQPVLVKYRIVVFCFSYASRG